MITRTESLWREKRIKNPKTLLRKWNQSIYFKQCSSCDICIWSNLKRNLIDSLRLIMECRSFNLWVTGSNLSRLGIIWMQALLTAVQWLTRWDGIHTGTPFSLYNSWQLSAIVIGTLVNHLIKRTLDNKDRNTKMPSYPLSATSS